MQILNKRETRNLVTLGIRKKKTDGNSLFLLRLESKLAGD